MFTDDKVTWIKAANWPDFRFEYHPNAQNVYLIRLAVEPPIGQVIAFNIDNEGAAHNAVQIYLRGYRAAKLEIQNGDQDTRRPQIVLHGA